MIDHGNYHSGRQKGSSPQTAGLMIIMILCTGAMFGCGRGRDAEPKQAIPSSALPSEAVVLLDRPAFTPGVSTEIGIMVSLLPGWHTYGDPPGDSGMAPLLKLTLPDGITAGPLQLPPVKTFKDEAGITYGYDKQVLMKTALALGAELTPGSTLEIGLRLDYLICKEACVPQRFETTIAVPVQADIAPVAKAWSGALERGGWRTGRGK